MPDQADSLAMGKSMLTAFYENIDLSVSGYAVVDVELPLSARLYTDGGLPTEFMLVGILDLLLMDENDEIVVVFLNKVYTLRENKWLSYDRFKFY